MQVAGQFIFLSIHLTSQKEKNKSQILHMIENLTKLSKTYLKRHIVIGIDANSYLNSLEKDKDESEQALFEKFYK